MSGFRPGDRTVDIAGVSHRLRLTVSALAEMASVFEAESPKALAARLRRATVSDWNEVLRIVAMPSPSRALQREELLSVLPEVSVLISDGLRA